MGNRISIIRSIYFDLCSILFILYVWGFFRLFWVVRKIMVASTSIQYADFFCGVRTFFLCAKHFLNEHILWRLDGFCSVLIIPSIIIVQCSASAWQTGGRTWDTTTEQKITIKTIGKTNGMLCEMLRVAGSLFFLILNETHLPSSFMGLDDIDVSKWIRGRVLDLHSPGMERKR